MRADEIDDLLLLAAPARNGHQASHEPQSGRFAEFWRGRDVPGAISGSSRGIDVRSCHFTSSCKQSNAARRSAARDGARIMIESRRGANADGKRAAGSPQAEDVTTSEALDIQAASAEEEAAASRN